MRGKACNSFTTHTALTMPKTVQMNSGRYLSRQNALQGDTADTDTDIATQALNPVYLPCWCLPHISFHVTCTAVRPAARRPSDAHVTSAKPHLAQLLYRS